MHGVCVVYACSLVAFAEEKQSPEVRCQRESLRTFRSVSATGRETPVFKAGQKVSEFRINVKNNGNVDAHNVRIEPDIKNASDWPFELDKLNYEKELSTIKSGGQTAAVWGVKRNLLS